MEEFEVSFFSLRVIFKNGGITQFIPDLEEVCDSPRSGREVEREVETEAEVEFN